MDITRKMRFINVLLRRIEKINGSVIIRLG